MSANPLSSLPSKKSNDGVSVFSTRRNQTTNWPKVKYPGNWRRSSHRLGFILLACLLLGFGGGYLGGVVQDHTSNGLGSTGAAANKQYVSSESQLISDIAQNVGQSVVSVNVQSDVTTPDYFGFGGQTQSQESAGTGFIVSSSGIIVTNRHVVPTGTTKVSVTLADGTTYDNVQVIGRSNASTSQDVAFLKIADTKGKKLVPVTLADSSKVKVGDRVVAIGNALGQFQNTVTSGIISGYGRDLTAGSSSGSASETLTDLFQTDAAINEGNSGGPLVNINGQVIGINTAVASGAQNIGFSIPINDIKGLISGVLNTGKFQQAYLGVHYVSLTNDIADQYNLSVKRGAYIISSDNSSPIVAGSPADKAGLKDKDIITKLDNTTIDDKTSLSSALSAHQVGDDVTLTVIRAGKTITLHVMLGNAPAS